MSIIRRAIFSITVLLIVIACVGKDLRNNLTPQQFIGVKDHLVAKLIKEQCIAAAGEEKGKQLFSVYEESVEELKKCTVDIMEPVQLQNDIETSVADANYAPLFHKYCQKRSAVLSCVDTFYSKITDCYREDEKEMEKLAKRLIEALLGFLCENDGEHVINLINGNGSECFQSKLPEIQECASTYFSDIIPDNFGEEGFTMPKIVITEEKCNHFKGIKTCIIEELQKCEQKAAATFIETLSNHLKKEVGFCSKYDKA